MTRSEGQRQKEELKMLKNSKLATKIAGGFAIVLILLIAVAYVGYSGLSGVTGRVDKADDVNRLIKLMLATRQQEKNFIIRGDKTYVDKVAEEVDAIKKQASETKSKFKDPANKQQMDEVLGAAAKYEKAFADYVGLTGKQHAAEEVMVKEARELESLADTIRQEQKAQYQALREKNARAAELDDKLSKADDAKRIIKWALEARRQEKNFIMRGDKEYAQLVEQRTQDIINLATEMKSRFDQATNKQHVDKIITAVQGYKGAFNNVVELKTKLEASDADMVTAARDAQEVSDKAREDQKAKMQAEITTANTVMMIGTLLALLVGSFLAFFMTRTITKPFKDIFKGLKTFSVFELQDTGRKFRQVIDALNEASSQVASASTQVATASQSLAEGSAEQAASLEETSSSLEEISSMTKQNADNANQADNLMKDANNTVGKANDSMAELTTSMDDITKASEETSKIIKTIDEIAFQTNLLALNAAVEAARAGEAGAGFAVVADEVRNLAMRAAEAAKNTAGLIEGTVKKVKDGADLVTNTNQAFSEVAKNVLKVGELVGEIAASSNEQAKGIEEVNKATGEMDKVTQQSAANAEESASASEEMNGQAEQMNGIVRELIAIIGANGQDGDQKQHSKQHRVGTVRRAETKSLQPQKREVKPDEVIPMEDADFKDF
jgi:methyl-accepting chemotaxis protein